MQGLLPKGKYEAAEKYFSFSSSDKNHSKIALGYFRGILDSSILSTLL